MFVKVLNTPFLSIKKLPIILKLVLKMQFSKQIQVATFDSYLILS